MKFIKYTDREKIEKYVNEREVITFITTRNTIDMTKQKHGGKLQHIQELLNDGYKRATKAKAKAGA